MWHTRTALICRLVELILIFLFRLTRRTQLKLSLISVNASLGSIKMHWRMRYFVYYNDALRPIEEFVFLLDRVATEKLPLPLGEVRRASSKETSEKKIEESTPRRTLNVRRTKSRVPRGALI